MGNVQGKGQEGGINQVDMNTSELLSQAMGQTGLQQRVELRLSARGLPKKDKLSKSDPMAVVFSASTSGQTQWAELATGRTEVAANTHEPSWVRPVLASYSQGSAQPMRVVVYDVDKVTRTAKQTKGLNLASQDYLGEAEFLLQDVMVAPGMELELQLTDVEGGRQLPPSCAVVLRAEPLTASDNRVVRMSFSASGLAKADLASQSDPFLLVHKLRTTGGGAEEWVPVCKTEVRLNNNDPVWHPIEVDIRQMCSADDKRPLKLQVFDYNHNGQHKLLGEARTTLAELVTLGAGPHLVASFAPPPAPAAAPGAAPGAGATPGGGGGGAAAAPGEVPGAAAPVAAAAPAALAAAPSASRKKTIELVAPGTAKVPGAQAGTLTVRQIMIKAGASPTQMLGGWLRGCLDSIGVKI